MALLAFVFYHRKQRNPENGSLQSGYLEEDGFFGHNNLKTDIYLKYKNKESCTENINLLVKINIEINKCQCGCKKGVQVKIHF